MIDKALLKLVGKHLDDLPPTHRECIATELGVPAGYLTGADYERYHLIYDSQRARRHGLAVGDVTADRHNAYVREIAGF